MLIITLLRSLFDVAIYLIEIKENILFRQIIEQNFQHIQ